MRVAFYYSYINSFIEKDMKCCLILFASEADCPINNKIVSSKQCLASIQKSLKGSLNVHQIY